MWLPQLKINKKITIGYQLQVSSYPLEVARYKKPAT